MCLTEYEGWIVSISDLFEASGAGQTDGCLRPALVPDYLLAEGDELLRRHGAFVPRNIT